MIAYRNLYDALEGDFDDCKSNEKSDTLANIGSTYALVPLGVFLEQICEFSIKPKAREGPSSASKDSRVAAPKELEGPSYWIRSIENKIFPTMGTIIRQDLSIRYKQQVDIHS